MVLLVTAVVSTVSFLFLLILLMLMWSNKRQGSAIMKSQEALIQEGNYKAAAITTEDVMVLVDKQATLKLLLMIGFSILAISTYLGFEYFNFAKYTVEIIKYLKWW